MKILSVLMEDMRSYFLSISDEGIIYCGGNDGARFYGKIEIKLLPLGLMVTIMATNDFATSRPLLPEFYPCGSEEHIIAVKLFKELGRYLSIPTNRIYQDQNRIQLLANTLNLLARQEN